MIIHNIDTSDCLTNGQLGVLVDVIKTTKGEADKLIIKLNSKNSGIQNRARFPGLAARYPECVFIERITNQYAIRKRSGDVSSTASVIQFPIKLAFAITSHKIQGQTIPMPIKVAVDIDSVFDDAQTHVILSRVQQIDQIYIVNGIDESKIRTSAIGLAETERLAKLSLNTNPTPWQAKCSDTVKVISMNCLGLHAHYHDIEADGIVKHGDLIHLIETSLLEGEQSPLTLENYECHLTSAGRGKGIATYYKADKFHHRQDFNTKNMQITMFTSKSLDVINVYRSSKGNSAELLAKLVEMMNPRTSTLITGDFNICFMNHERNRMSKGLIEGHGMQQLMTEPTHILGGHIDHVYWKDEPNQWMAPIIERYSPYYSDHDGSCVTIKMKMVDEKKN